VNLIRELVNWMPWRNHLAMYDAIERHLAMEKMVLNETERGLERKYWRFRPDCA